MKLGRWLLSIHFQEQLLPIVLRLRRIFRTNQPFRWTSFVDLTIQLQHECPSLHLRHGSRNNRLTPQFQIPTLEQRRIRVEHSFRK